MITKFQNSKLSGFFKLIYRIGLVIFTISLIAASILPRKPTECDAPIEKSYGFQTPATSQMESIVNLHNFLIMYYLPIIVLIVYLLVQCVYRSSIGRNFKEATTNYSYRFSDSSFLELAWTIIPCIILIFVAQPSYLTLVESEIDATPKETIKVIGRQWYWEYQYCNWFLNIDKIQLRPKEMTISFLDKKKANSIAFKSYIVPEKKLSSGQFRLLEVDNRLVIPEKTYIKYLITSVDVIHSWAIPSFGTKVDACPGRINSTIFSVDRIGIYYGQCSELCGSGHSLMPIVVKVIPQKEFTLFKLDIAMKNLKRLTVLEKVDDYVCINTPQEFLDFYKKDSHKGKKFKFCGYHLN